MYGAKVLTPQKTIFWMVSWKIGNLHLRILYLFSLNLRKYHFDSGNFFSSLDKSPVGLNKGEVCKKWVIFTADLEQKEAIFASSESPVKNVICSYVSLKTKMQTYVLFLHKPWLSSSIMPVIWVYQNTIQGWGTLDMLDWYWRSGSSSIKWWSEIGREGNDNGEGNEDNEDPFLPFSRNIEEHWRIFPLRPICLMGEIKFGNAREEVFPQRRV